MAGPTIASAEVSVTLDGDRILIQARAIASQAGRAMEKEFDKSGRGIGRSFDGFLGRLRNSRNDFLHFIGVVGGGLERLVGTGVSKVFDTIGGAVGRLGEKLTGLGGDGGPLGAVGTMLGTLGEKIQGLGGGGFDGFLVQLGILALALQSLVAIAGPIAAGISGIAGAFVALSVSLGGAALGALLTLGPVLAAVGAGAGAAVIGILGMSDAMKDALGPLEDWYTTAKDVVSSALFANIGAQAAGLADILTSRLTPLLEASATAISDWADRFLEALNGPAMQAATEVLNTELPTILTNLLDTFTGFSTGLGSVLAAIAPGVTEITSAISGVAAEFSAWAASAEGQESIKTFFEEAAETGAILWDIVKEVSGVIGDLFSGGGNDAGQGLLTSIRDIVAAFNTWLDTEEGRAELEAWFQNAQDVAGALGGIIGDLIDLFAALDTPSNRSIFLAVIDGVSGLIDALTWVSGVLESVRGYFLDFSARAQDVGNIVGTVADGIQSAWEGMGSFFEGIWNAVLNAFTSVGTALSDAWAAVQEAPQNIQNWFDTVLVPWFAALPERLWQGFLGLVEMAAALPGQIIGGLANLGAMLLETFTTAFTTALTAIGTFITNAVTFVQELPGRIVTGLASMAATLGAFFGQVWTTVRTRFLQGVNDAVAAAKTLPGLVLSGISSLLAQLGAFVATVWTNARNAFITGVSNVVNEARQLPGKVFGALQSLGSQIVAAISRGMGEGGRAFVQGVGNLVNEARAIPGKIAAAIGNLGSTLYSAGQDLIRGLINGVKSMASNAISSVKDLGSNMVSGIQGILGIGSPSKVFADIGRDMIEGLVIGLDRNAPRAVSTVDNIGRSLIPDWSNVNTVTGTGNASPVVGAGAGARGGNTIIVEPGAIQYVTPLSDPRLVAIQSLDELVVRLGG